MNQERIAVVGLGYVGLPIAVALAGKYDKVYGFDISKPRIEELKSGEDSTLEIEPEKLKKAKIQYSANL